MQLFDGLKVVLLALGLLAAPASQAHPYEGMPEDSPMVFILHITDDGRRVIDEKLHFWRPENGL